MTLVQCLPRESVNNGVADKCDEAHWSGVYINTHALIFFFLFPSNIQEVQARSQMDLGVDFISLLTYLFIAKETAEN